MLPSFARQPATIVRPSWTSNHGNKVANFDDPASTRTVARCSVQPATGGELTDHRDAVLGQFTIWLPAGTDVKARDRIRIGGTDYDVVGEPQRWETGVLDHVQVQANRWEG